MTKSAEVTIERYPVVVPDKNSDVSSVYVSFLFWLYMATLIWLGQLALFEPSMCFVEFLILLISFLYQMSMNTTGGRHFVPTKLDLKAKGMDIKSNTVNLIMPWSWLVEVELRHRRFSIIPNYVYFKFKDQTDILILWDDLHTYMDTVTLISCVKTWAPRAKVRGDVKRIKVESIASYTELWLKDLNANKNEKRRRQDQTLPVDTVLSGSYSIECILSAGGQGTAYLASVLPQAELPDMPKKVVIKEFILPENASGLKKAQDSLVKEVTILQRIHHPQIIRLYDFFIEDMRGYFAIEYVDGQTLRQLVEHNGVQSEDKVSGIAIALCDAISYLHGLSPAIIHGDVTPDNVMIDQDGAIKLLDFDASQELTRNKTNTVVGKHAYMSPEQFKGILSETSDIYALGCTLHFLLTGADPEPISESRPADFNKNVSDKMNDIIAGATKFEHGERTSNLNVMRSQLEQLR